MRDLVIAGGGPVGLATALYAHRAGLDVTVREPRAGVIDKACGEGLMPGAVLRLRDLGVRLEGHPITGIRYLDRSRSVEAPFRRGHGMGVRRTRLHRALLDRVAEVGIEISGAAVREIEDRADHLTVDGESTRYLIAADGLHSPVRRLVGLEGPAVAHRRYGQRRHVAMAPWTSMVEVHWSTDAEAYVTPVGDHEIGIALLTRQRRPFDELISQFPTLLARTEGQSWGAVRGAGPLRHKTLGRRRGRVLLVGDAAGYVDALTGEGIALGMAQAEAAVTAVVQDRPSTFQTRSKRLGLRHDVLTLGLVTATRLAPVRRLIVPAAHRLPAVFGAAVDQLARPV